MNEAKFQIKFDKWCKYCWKSDGNFELKLTKTKSLPFSALKLHQELALLAKTVRYKIADVGLAPKPFDYFITKAKGYVVVMFYQRGQKDFYMFGIDDWMFLKNTHSRKSITEVDANLHGIKYTLK